jgi:hypothetical protein
MKKLDFAVLEAAHKTATGVDLVAIHELDAPLVASLQEQIRQQHALIESMGEAIAYTLLEIKKQPELMKEFYMSVEHAKLVTALAQKMREPRWKIADLYAAIHERSRDYGCVDDCKYRSCYDAI